jgi:hypothetical protein
MGSSTHADGHHTNITLLHAYSLMKTSRFFAHQLFQEAQPIMRQKSAILKLLSTRWDCQVARAVKEK